MSLNNHTRSLFTDQKSTLEGLQNISLAKVRDRINVYTSTTSTSLASTVTTSMGATGIARMVNRLMEECEVLRNDVAMAHQDI